MSSKKEIVDPKTLKNVPHDGEDVAGPMLGWSLEHGLQDAAAPTQSLSDLIDFPTRYTFKVVGLASDSLEADVLFAMQKALDRELGGIKRALRPSAKGKYASLSVEVEMQSAKEIYAIYDVLKDLPSVRYVL